MTKFDWWGDRADAGTNVPEIQARLQREQSAIGWTHEAPDAPLSVEHTPTRSLSSTVIARWRAAHVSGRRGGR